MRRLLIVIICLAILVGSVYGLSAWRFSAGPAGMDLTEGRAAGRGAIITSDGLPLAKNERRKGRYVRTYPFGKMTAAVTGYWHAPRGRNGLEMTQDWYLSGQPSSIFRFPIDWLRPKRRHGADVLVTIDSRLQKAAWRALGKRKGAVVVLNPRTGAVLAMVSRPTFNPNTVGENWPRLAPSDQLMRNRATEVLFPPASTFKVITTAAAVDAKIAGPRTLFYPKAKIVVGPQGVRVIGDRHVKRVSVQWAFVNSNNPIFIQMALIMGSEKLVSQAQALGFNDSPPFDLPVAKSSIPDAADMLPSTLASVAVGGRTQVTALQMALVAASAASGGPVPSPYLVSQVRDGDRIIFTRRSSPWRPAPFAPKVAQTLRHLMEQVVISGTGTAARIPGMRVAGKTGTTWSSVSGYYAWFIGFAPSQKAKIAVAVVINDSGGGGRIAAPVAKAVFQAAVRKNGPAL